MPHRIFRSNLIVSVVFSITLFAAACSAQQTEEQALQSLREAAKDGKLPPETVAASVESRFSGKRTGLLAKLLRARIRFENGDFAGAAALLNSDDFASKTKVADYALWLRGRALQQAGNHAEAMKVFSKFDSDYANSLHTTEAKLLWADSAIASGQGAQVPAFLAELNANHNADAMLRIARAHESARNQAEAVKFFRRIYFYGAGTEPAKEAEAKLTSLVQPLTPETTEEIKARARDLSQAKNYAAAEKAYTDLALGFPSALSPTVNLDRLTVLSNLKKAAEAQSAFNAIPVSAMEKEEAYYQLAMAYARARLWPQARHTLDEMRAKFPAGKLTPKTFVDVGATAAAAKNKGEEQYFLRTALAAYPNAVEVAGAQFELAWSQHETGNFALSSQMLTEHLARYVDKDTTNRGKAGYWAARDSQRAGKIAEACALYEGVMHRYSANWYGYIAEQRLKAMRGQGQCRTQQTFPAGSLVAKAVANLKSVTVSAETSTPNELARAEKSEELTRVGLFDWAIGELEEAKKTARNSPKINLALAKHYRMKGDNVNALLALAKSYPDYSQMFPEEMGREEWDIFYPLSNWEQIKAWAKTRGLDHYQVAGLIRQESVFNPRAASHANAYGLMQLILPTARATARKYGSTAAISPEALFYPPLNIELGTAYMRDQLDKFGRIEYMAVAYNAGPGRVPQWRATLPIEIDEFVEAIPFKETKGYVQGVIRNSAQYRRLYDEDGNFKPNVGTRPLRVEIDTKTRERIAVEFPEIVIE